MEDFKMKILTPISVGELYDKISILEIKLAYMDSPEKIANVANEYKQLRQISENYPINQSLYEKLKNVNQQIWDIEDGIREEERNKDWGEEFIQFARNVYFMNDKRAAIKKEINTIYGSEIVEEKSYKKY